MPILNQENTMSNKKFGKINFPLHICTAMKIQNINNMWWWHTNLFRGL